jgi:hypothetical protein
MASMIILTIPILLLIIPIAFQIVMGQKSLNEKILMPYWWIAISSFLLEIFMTIIGLFISFKGQQMKGIGGLSPGVLGIGFFAIIILFAVTIIQYLSNKFKVKSK